MSEFTSADINRLTDLLQNELELLGKVRKLTDKQTTLLAEDDITPFERSLDERQELIEKINGLHQESNPLMQSCASQSPDSKKSKIDDLKKKIRETVEICAGLNDKNILTMRDKTEDHTKKIDEQSAKRKGIGGYAQSVPNTPEMFDKKT